MSSKAHSEQSRVLRHICNRLDTANVTEITHIASALSSNLPLCRDLLSCSDEQLKGFASNAAALSSRYRNKLSSLLQDKSEARKLAAIKLIKATVQVGGHEILARSGHWVRGLTNCIRSSWTTLRCLAITTVVSIFRLTHGLSNLTREITTPSLPDFIAICIDSIAPKERETGERIAVGEDEYLLCVLSALATLLPNHPAVFRPFANQLTATLGTLIVGNLDREQIRSEALRACAQSLHALLPRCATKNEGGPAQKWLNHVRLVEQQIHGTANEVFRSLSLPVNGYNEGNNSLQQFSSAKSRPEDPPSSEIVDGLCLKKWIGIDAGINRLVDLIHLLEAYIGSNGQVMYSIHLNPIVEVLKRMLSAFPGQHSSDLATTSRASDISTEELETLFEQANRIQIAALECLTTTLRRIGPVGKGFAHGILEELLWKLRNFTESSSLRAKFYEGIAACIFVVGPVLSKSFVSRTDTLLDHVVADVFGETLTNEQNNSRAGSKGQRHDADAYFQTSKIQSRTLQKSEASDAASALLETILQRIPSSSFKSTTRAMIDRAAILSRDRGMMLASVLNTMSDPQSERLVASIVPFLAREHPSSQMVEGILRPRLPVLLSTGFNRRGVGQNTDSAYYIAQSEEEEEEIDEEEDNMAEDLRMSNDRPMSITEDQARSASPQSTKNGLVLEKTDQSRQTFPESTFVKGRVPHLPANATSIGSHEDKRDMIESRRGSILSSGSEIKEPLLPSSPKRTRPAETETSASGGDEKVKRIKLATYEAAPGPTSVSAFVSKTQKVTGPAGGVDADDDGNASDNSSIPPIIMDADTDVE